MVFESLIVDLINRYLGDYIEALNASQLKIGLLGGNARLENVDVKTNAFDSLNLPVKVLQGHIGSLILKIPFKNLYTEPTVVELDGLYILVVPNTAVKYDEQKEAMYRREAKQRELRDIVEAYTNKGKSAPTENKADSFGEKLAAQIVKNLQVDVRNIHIRYEDSYSIPGQTFSLGLTLNSLTFKTLSESHSKDDSFREFAKFVELNSFGIYWNHNCTVFSEKGRVPLRAAMQSLIASPENRKTGSSYILQPISSTAHLNIHTRPEDTGFKTPRIKLEIDFTEIQFNFSLYQYRDLTSFLDATDRMITQSKYIKYRPQVSLTGNPKARWAYALNAILEEFVRRRRRVWSWAYIKNHRSIVKDYIQLWRKRLRDEKLSQEQKRLLQEYEDYLDVFNIVLCRQQAEVQHGQTKKKTSKSGGMFRWFRSSSTTSDSDTSSSTESEGAKIIQRLQSEMTPEEKARLYAAINYSESATPSSKFPPTYVSTIVSLTLHQFSFVLLDHELSDPRILKLAVNKLTAGVQQREGDQAMSVKLRLDSLEALGARPSLKLATAVGSSSIPILVTSNVVDAQTETERSTRHLLALDFEKNPLDRKADQRVHIKADPLQIIYDAETVNKIVHFFSPPKDIRLQELSSQVLTSLEDVKEVTVSGLRHLASQRAYTEVHVDVRPSYFILPDYGVFRNDTRMLLVDLGSLSVRSSPNSSRRRQSQPTKPDDTESDRSKVTFDELKEDAYDIYDVTISSVQVLMIEEGDNWRSLRSQAKSPNHILRPLGLNFSLKRCLLQNDINLPKLLIDGCLPVFSVDLTDRVLKSLFELVANVPFPEPDPRLTSPEDPLEVLKDTVILPADSKLPTREVIRAARRLGRESSTSTLNSYLSGDFDEEEEEPNDDEDQETFQDASEDARDVESLTEEEAVRIKARRASRQLQREAAMQRRKRANLIEMKLDFVVRTVQVQILKGKTSEGSLDTSVMLCISIYEVGATMIKRRWDQEVDAHIGTLLVSIPAYIDPTTKEPVCLAKTKRHIEGHHLLALCLLVADKTAPEFEKHYKNTRHKLKCEFKSLDVCVHQEATLLLLDFMNSLLHELTLPSSTALPDKATTAEIQWAARIGDKLGLEEASMKAALEEESSKQLPSNLTAVTAIEGHLARRAERRSIRLQAAAEVAKANQIMFIREVNMIQWLINSTLDTVTFTLCSEGLTLLTTTVHGLRLDVQTSYLTTEVSAILSDFSVTDRIEQTNYRKVIWVDPGESIACIQLTHFSQGTQLPENACDPEKVDMSLSVHLGKIHMVYLNHFVMRSLDFVKGFQLQAEELTKRVQELSDVAVQQVQTAVSQVSDFRLALNIIAQAPALYLPQHSFSSKALLLDFGCITYTNNFEFVTEAPEGASGPVPSPGIMLEHSHIQLDNLRLTRAVLCETEVKAEKRLVHPINIVLKLQRNLSRDAYSVLPMVVVEGTLNSIHMSLCQGDYRVIQEVLMDNFAERPDVSHLSATTRESKSRPEQALSDSKPRQLKSPEGPQLTPKSTDVNCTARFKFVVGTVSLDLFNGEMSMSEWKNKVPAELNLALCSLSGFQLGGQVFSDDSMEIQVKLARVTLRDTRPDAEKQIVDVLTHTTTLDGIEELVYVEFKQDASRQQKVNLKLQSIHLCASMKYLLELANFHLQSHPVPEKKTNVLAPLTEVGKHRRREDPVHQKPTRRSDESSLKEYPNEMDLTLEMGDPELVLVENVSSLDTNSLKLTAGVKFRYSVRKDVAIMDAVVRGLVIVACPYNASIGSKHSKEILSPTDLNFYSKQAFNDRMQASLFTESLIFTINPATIQMIGHIMSSIQAETQMSRAGKDQLKKPTDLRRMSRDLDDQTNLWDPVHIEDVDLPFLKPRPHSLDKTKQPPPSAACDVSKVLEQMEARQTDKRKKDIIVVRVQKIRVVLESQIGTRSMPMFVLESVVEGDIIDPSGALELKMSIDLSLSYFNDVLNEWEYLLEPLPDEGGRMWSLQLEFTSTNVDELLAEEDMDEIGCLQVSANSIMLVSRDNLELTLSKTAMDMLSDLAKTFEQAYKRSFDDSAFELGGQSTAPYRIQNRTGLSIVLQVDPQVLTVMQDTHQRSVFALRKSYSTLASRSTRSIHLGPFGQEGRGLGQQDVKVPDLALRSITTGSYILDNNQELGFIEPHRASRKSFNLTADRSSSARHVIRMSWYDPRHSDLNQIPRVPFHLHSSGGFVLQLPKPKDQEGPPKDTYPLSVVVQVTTHLGMRVITLRSTVQIVNETSEVLSLFTRLQPISPDGRITRFATLDVGEVYSMPIEMVNSRQLTGFYIGPEVGTKTVSTSAAYWPESACSFANLTLPQSSDLVYLNPLTEITRTSSSQPQTISTTLSVKSAEQSRSYEWPVQLMQCPTKSSNLVYFYSIATIYSDYIRVVGDTATSSRKSAASGSTVPGDFQLIIRNAVALHNLLPFSVNYTLSNSIGEVEPGARCQMTTVDPSGSAINVWFEYDQHVYRGDVTLQSNLPELSVVTFESREGYELRTLYLGLRCATILGQINLSLYAPYWMINKTNKDLTYKSGDDSVIKHPRSFCGAFLYSSLEKSALGKQKVCLKVDESNWSDKFSLDTVGNSGLVTCKTKDKMSYQIGVKIDLASSGLTRIVTLMPYFLIANNSSIDLECCEAVQNGDRLHPEEWILVPAGEAVPFWPQATASKKMLLKCRVNKNLVTDMIPFYESHSILMKLPGKHAGIFVEVQTTEEATLITLQLYQEGMAMVRIVNHLGDFTPVYYQQRGVERVHTLEAGMTVLYTWDSPQSERELVFYCEDKERSQSSALITDCIEEFYVNDTKAYWVSFLSNMQRILLFTQDVNVAKNARLSADLEPIDLEMILSLQSIGLSLVNHVSRAEVAYLSVTSSGVRWSQVKRGNRLKPLKSAVSDGLERAYTGYVNNLRTGDQASSVAKLTDVGRTVEVDFSQMMMLQPDQCELRRAFEPGVFVHYKNSASQMHLHSKIFRIQLDNQRLDCTFPVVLAPYPQPKSVALDTGPKPLVELSTIISRTAIPGTFRFKYFKVLVQEMVFKLDQGFLNDLFDFFSANVSRIPENEAFQRDCQLIEKRLIDSPIVVAHLQSGARSIFDNFHISPIKVHVSFSLTGSSDGKSNAFPSEVLNLFLQSLGVALTEIQDVVFRLGYFECVACTMTLNQLASDISRHYVGQGVRQMYALILGLDVLGNPYGVLRGMAQGVEDLFYEPVKGAVLGPEEFAEGVALGVRSLFGHAVGGAAGAVSRITGTIGKGVAALTLDEDYKRRRREQMARKPGTIGAGLAQGGRGLVMGIFHGVTGVVMKPVEGAKKEGVEGFFKGVGKGLVGAVTRPVSGVVDFASSSFEGIRRLADGVGDTGRIRPPRYLRLDNIIRPYDRREAEGNLILRQLDKSNISEQYVYHVPGNRGSNILLLTAEKLLITEPVDLLGTWKINWESKLNALAGVPTVNQSGILITLREKQKKLLSSGHQTRQFDCERNLAITMVGEIDAALSKQESLHSPKDAGPDTST